MKKGLSKKIGMILLSGILVLALAACGEQQTTEMENNGKTYTSEYQDFEDEGDSNFPADYNPLPEMERETLLYPSQNDKWSYNVYDSYIEITAYLGDPVTELVIPDKIENLPVKAIGEFFSSGGGKFNMTNTREITSVKLPKSMVVLRKGALSSLRKMEKINLPEGLIEIGKCALQSSESLHSIKLPSTLKTIGSEAFRGSRLDSITIPANVKNIDAGAFFQCGSISEGTYYIMEEVTILSPMVSLDVSDIKCRQMRGKSGSTAAAFAAKKSIPFKVIE